MIKRQTRYIAGIVLLLYVGYYSCVSLFVHTHIQDGTIYLHSHPYKKDADGNKLEHNHSNTTFFYINQLSSITSSLQEINVKLEVILSVHVLQFIDPTEDVIIDKFDDSHQLRAPPYPFA